MNSRSTATRKERRRIRRHTQSRAPLIVILIALLFTPIALTSNQTPPQQKRIDLTGLWEDRGEDVTIADSGSTVTANYSKQKQCKHDGSVTPYKTGFVVSGSGNTLTGTGTICYFGNHKPGSSGPRGVKHDSKVTLTVSADGNTLTGTQVGHLGPISFTLTRKCQPDSGKLCEGIGRAIAMVKAAQVPAGSASLYQNLQQNAGVQLSGVRNELCDNEDAQRKLDEVVNDLNSLNYVSPQANLQNNLRLRHMEEGLRDLAQMVCAVGPPPGTTSVTCPDGRTVESGPDDNLAIKTLKDLVNEAIDKEIGGQGPAAAKKIRDRYKTILGMLDQVKAASCLPKELQQALNDYLNRKTGSGGDTGECNTLCAKTTDWMVSLMGDERYRTTFYNFCNANCN
jgi:hypothetical protein